MNSEELKISMQVATSDVASDLHTPRVRIFSGDDEIGILTFEGEVLDGDLRGSFLKYTLQQLEKMQDVLQNDWDELAREV